MGYYTQYRLDIYRDDRNKELKANPKEIGADPYGEEDWDDENDPIAVLRGFSDDAAYAIDENGDTSEGTKWYSHDEDLIKLSKKFPEIVFRLHGEGEEPGDLWDKYYKNGKTQFCKAKIVFDDFDEDELVTWKDPMAKYKKLGNVSKFTDFKK